MPDVEETTHFLVCYDDGEVKFLKTRRGLKAVRDSTHDPRGYTVRQINVPYLPILETKAREPMQGEETLPLAWPDHM